MGLTGFVVEVISEIGSHINGMSSSEAIIFDIALILIISAVFAFVAKILRQPLIPAYVIAGLLIGPLVFGFVQNLDLIYAFSKIGIAFLLFTAGLEISFKKIKEAGLKRIMLVGLLQVGIIFGVVFLFADILGLTSLQASYIGIILAFGSTMVDIKLLSDKGELVTLYGRLVLGILLLQDLVAIVAIVIFTSGSFAFTPLIEAFVKLGGVLVFAIFLQKYVLNKLFKFAARSAELLFLSSLAVLFLFIILAYLLELSIVIGAFIAGVSLANSQFKIELESRISPLRDFFAILFFVALGMQVVFTGISGKVVLFVGLLVGAFILKPFITLILLRIAGYRSRTSFLTSISLAQLSEFSLIIGFIGVSMGVIDTGLLSTVILATIVTMSVTPYFINYKNWLYRFFKYPVAVLKFLPMREDLEYDKKNDKEILLVGSHRVGGALMEELLGKKDKLLVVDYNPEIIGALMKKEISCIYGDVTSPELLGKVDVKNLKVVISTIPGYDENMYLVKMVKKINPNVRVVVVGERISETLNLYKAGADYVVTPKILAGRELADIVHGKKFDFKKTKEKHLKYLKEIHRLLY